MKLYPTRFLCLLATLLLTGAAGAQDLKQMIRSSALPLASPAYLPDSIVKTFRPFRVVMVGEMHGTRESALFAGALAEALARGGDSVLLGLEINGESAGTFLQDHTEASLLASPFFQGITGDGRNSAAWKELLLGAVRNGRIQPFFFDSRSPARDSMMAVNIAHAMEVHPGWKVVTLSGNMHNKIRPLNGSTKAASYLMQHGGRDLNGRLCAVNIAYEEATMWADMGDGLKLRSVKSDNVFAQAAPSDQYLLFLDPRSEYDYHAVLFIRKLTASAPVK
jgi:hypothetical protein